MSSNKNQLFIMKRNLLFLSLLILSIPSFSQGNPNEEEYYDIRVKKLLDSKDINYSITKNNNFRITVITEDSPKERTQGVIINSKTQNYDEYEIREIWSTSLKIKKSDLRVKLYYELLSKNSKIKVGAWEITEYESDKEFYFLTFNAKINTNINSEDLKSLLFLIANEADRVEKLHGNGIDEY